ncbi:MAG TPA: VTT domain-containing protein [Labilithrix sp.]|nr:VTT domain-containing protein [Labilithrix sp.]
MSKTTRSVRTAKLGVVALVLLLVACAWHFGVFARLAEPSALARSLVEMGAWGYVAFIVAYTVLQPFGVPGTIFIVAAPLIWPWPTAFALSMTGTMGASVVGFSFARFVAKDWVSPRIPATLRKYDEALGRNAFQTVVILRLIFWMPQVLHSFFGVSNVGFWTHFWGSLVGYVPPLLIVSYLGSEMFDASGKMKPDAWPIMGGLLVTSLVIATIARLRRRTSTTKQPKPQGGA